MQKNTGKSQDSAKMCAAQEIIKTHYSTRVKRNNTFLRVFAGLEGATPWLP
jgi:hypothetical protein